MWIDTKIVFEPNNKLAYAYNRAIENTLAEWILFLDQDLFICNFDWYNICLNTIEKVKHLNVGWITAKCNRISCPVQRIDNPILEDDNLITHIKFANKLYKEKKGQITLTTKKLSGFFILTNKTAWKSVNGFKQTDFTKISKIDNQYSIDIINNGFKQIVMEDLYFYHLWKYKKKEIENENCCGNKKEKKCNK